MNKKAVVLLSGGMDSAVTLFIAKKYGYRTSCLTFDYGQRHKKEILFAKVLAKAAKSQHIVLKISLPWKKSALLDRNIEIPENRNISGEGKIPATYVPARNTIFLSFALSYAEAIGANAVFIGANAVDFSGYPDCRPEYYKVFNELFKKATKLKGIKIVAPLLYKTKEEVVKLGRQLGVDFNLTWSCYKGGRKPCGVCDACRLRKKGFQTATS